MLKLAAVLAGMLIGLALKRRWRPLLLERWRALFLLPLLLLVSLLPALLARFAPDLLWTEDRSLLISLQAFTYLLALLLILINVWPRRPDLSGRPVFRWYHRLPLAIVSLGLIAEAAVILLNHGYMPIPESYLADLGSPAAIEAVRNQSLYLKQLISDSTRVPWLGQIWRCDWLASLKLIPFPYISPAEVLTACGLFLSGLSQFWGWTINPAASAVPSHSDDQSRQQ